MSVGGQDMLVGYNAPVANLTLIGKPLVWGYVLLGNDYGLAWYFAAKYVLMFMGCLEMFYILTHKKALSVFGGFFLTWARDFSGGSLLISLIRSCILFCYL